MRKALLFGASVPLVLFLGTDATSISSGIFPNSTVTVNAQNYAVGALTRHSSNSCGGSASVTVCHSASPFLTKVAVAVGLRVLPVQGTTAINITGTNAGVSGTRGGFCADVTGGMLVPGTNTQTNASGNAITHQNAFATGRSWTFTFNAGATPGLVELYTVVNCVDGDGRAGGADQWAFNSSKVLADDCTPVRLFVNAPGVTATGDGCADGYGNYSVLGSATTPNIGNSQFAVEAHGLPPQSAALVMLSLGANPPPFDMAPLGAPGCVLRTAMQFQLGAITGPGDAVRSEGKMTLPIPIPNDSTLRGLVIAMQVGAIDLKPIRAFPMVVTNGIEIKLQ
ncbi:MAG: hypothetical protein KDC87_05065 [Planctomycetes bacterium]|nr:hypothetical protein [Planctomycetota bacterium]MCB9871465.1 hypothetical protein [Planctomycetota bacterium]